MTTEIGQQGRLFNLVEALELLPLVRSLTESHREMLQPIQQRLNRMLSNDPRRMNVEHEFEYVVSRWKAKIELLGPIVYGLWVVEFDVGEGYLSWRYPEIGINFFRPNGEQFANRQRLSRYIEDTDPDWIS